MTGKLISCEFFDIDHFREQLCGWDTPAIQIEPGQLSIHLHSIDLGGLILSDIRVNKKVIDYSNMEDGWLQFVVTFSPAVFCGLELNAGYLALLTPGREYRNVLPNNWHSIEIVISSSVLAHEGLWLTPHLVSGPENASVPLSPKLIDLFCRLAAAAFGGNGTQSIDHVRLRCALLHALDKALRVSATGRHMLDCRHRVKGYKLTQKMIRYIESRPGQRITVNDVACELEVTPRALNYAARSILGMSPLDLILAFRLNLVRNKLWEARYSEPCVTTAALNQDFWHLGRFSQQYRAQFGELPSQMVHRVRQLMRP